MVIGIIVHVINYMNII